jgi:tetratricopeptide (TPR) repeat protein
MFSRRAVAALASAPSKGALWIRRELDAFAKQALRAASTLLALLLLVPLMAELILRPSPDAKLVGTLAVCFLGAVFLAGYGGEVAGRIKKIGPVEFLELQQRTGWALQEVATLISRGLEELDPARTRLTPSQQFAYEEGDYFLSFVVLSAAEPKEEDPSRKILFEMLYQVGRVAHTQKEWFKAIKWMERVEKLSAGTYRRGEVSNLIAFSELLYALQESTAKDRKEKLEDFVDRYERLAGSKRLSYEGYFWLAYGQDELERYHEAVQAYREVLARRPRHAPGRFNMAISLLKMGLDRDALRCLEEIRPSHEGFATVRDGARDDLEMKELVEKVADRRDERLLRRELRRLSEV